MTSVPEPIIRNSAKALLLDRGKLLLNSHLDSTGNVYYDLPGGGQHPLETMEEAVVREVLEETGFTAEPIRFAAMAEEIFTNPDMQARFPQYCHRVMHIFLVRLCPNAPKAKAELDFQQTGSVWVLPEEAEAMPLVPIQLRGQVRQVLASETPVYLGSVRRDEICM